MNTKPDIDEIDLQILEHLLMDSSLSHKHIGERIPMTGQAVGARIRKLQDLGVIEGYTLRWNPDKIGLHVHAFVTVFLHSPKAHSTFQAYALEHKHIAELHRVSGEGCYWMRVRISTPAELNDILDELLRYGNYKLSLSISQVK